MTISDKENLKENQENIQDCDYTEDEESGLDCDDCSSDDSETDPSYSIIKDTNAKFSKLSITKKSNSRSSVRRNVHKGNVENLEDKIDDSKLDWKSYEGVQQIIEAGQLEKLKVEQCRVYLRRNGLRLTGIKATLLTRIKEHQEVLNGGGESMYPLSSFVLDCKGDACKGDVVMFEQNVYELFKVASRSASGPPCGTRIVAGRIVKESYGAAKQQHTFTIEVLWSKGEKPLPPLHPLLIKGRNLYRLKTLRQKWEDEEERRKVITEKHSRGYLARSSRDVRVQQKERRQMLRANREIPEQKKTTTKIQPQQLHKNVKQAAMAPQQNCGNEIQHQQTSVALLYPLPINNNTFNKDERNRNYHKKSLTGSFNYHRAMRGLSPQPFRQDRYANQNGYVRNNHQPSMENHHSPMRVLSPQPIRQDKYVNQNGAERKSSVANCHSPLRALSPQPFRQDKYVVNQNGFERNNSVANYQSPMRALLPQPFRQDKYVNQNGYERNNHQPSMAKHHSPIRVMSPQPYRQDKYVVNQNGFERNDHRPSLANYHSPTRALSPHPFRQDKYLNHNGNERNGHQPSMANRFVDCRHVARKQQLCRYYAMGRCHFGETCKFSHEQSVACSGTREENLSCGPR